MRTEAANVKQLAPPGQLCHGCRMEKAKQATREQRLAEALRANLRRRKVAKGNDAESTGKGPIPEVPAAKD
jgi:hypothetical protein